MVAELDRDLPRIIAQAQAGDASAFGEIYTRYAGHILRYLYARLREQESAQDLTQEVFVRVIKGIGTFEYRGEKSFLGWLYTIAGNVLIGQVRRKHPISTPLDDGIDLVDPHGQEAVLSLFERLSLRQAIDQLTADQQQVLMLKFFADLSNGEIAQVIGRTEGAVKALQHRALNALHLILEREAWNQFDNDTDPNGASIGIDEALNGEQVRIVDHKREKRRRVRGPYTGS